MLLLLYKVLIFFKIFLNLKLKDNRLINKKTLIAITIKNL